MPNLISQAAASSQDGVDRNPASSGAIPEGLRRDPPEPEGPARRGTTWLSINDVHEILGNDGTGGLKALWRTLVHDAVSGRPTMIDGVVLRIGTLNTKLDKRWCIHRSNLLDVARICMPADRRWPAKPEGWLTLEEAVVHVGPDIPTTVIARAWSAIANGERLVLVDGINPLDFRMQSQIDPPRERALMHCDDVDALALALKEHARSPRRAEGFMTPGQILRRIEPDRHELALRALKFLGERTRGGSVALEGRRIRLRHFVVQGKSTPCLEDSAFPHFAQCLDALRSAFVERGSYPRRR